MKGLFKSLLSSLVISSLISPLPAKAEVNAVKLQEVLSVNQPVAIPSTYNKGCIFQGHGASVEYWYVLKPSVCTNAVGNARGKEQRLENFVDRGYGFRIFTICTSNGTLPFCKDKPTSIPFSSPNKKAQCIKPVARKGWNSVVCVEGLPQAQTKPFLLSLASKPDGITRETSSNPATEQYVGLRYKREVNGLNSFGGWVIGDPYSEPVYAIEYFVEASCQYSPCPAGTRQMLWLKTVTSGESGQTEYLVLDVITLPDLLNSANQVTNGCLQNGTLDPELVAIARYEPDQQYLTKVLRAWRANRTTAKFEPVQTKGIRCYNRGWGV